MDEVAGEVMLRTHRAFPEWLTILTSSVAGGAVLISVVLDLSAAAAGNDSLPSVALFSAVAGLFAGTVCGLFGALGRVAAGLISRSTSVEVCLTGVLGAVGGVLTSWLLNNPAFSVVGLLVAAVVPGVVLAALDVFVARRRK